jgi:hypothetical protein
MDSGDGLHATRLDVMEWAREHGCTFEGCDSKDAWLLIEPTEASIVRGFREPDEVAVLCQHHTKLMADEKWGGDDYPVELIRFVKVGSQRQ